MIGLLQRVSEASVHIDGESVGRIGQGLLVFVGIEREDTEAIAARLLERILGYRVFADDPGRMNLSVRDVAGGLLLVPQVHPRRGYAERGASQLQSCGLSETGAGAVCRNSGAGQTVP